MNKAGAEGGPSWSLVIIGLILTGIGLCWVFLPSFPKLGKLPGDIRIEGKGGGFYFPVVTCLLISVVLSLILWIVRTVMRWIG
jgi:hypothetical protein